MNFLSSHGRGTLFAAALLLTTPLMAQDSPTPQSSPISYFLGLDVGNSLARQGLGEIGLDASVFALGLADALKGGESQLSDEELRAASGQLQAIMQRRAQEAQKKLAEEAEMNAEKGATFLAENAKKPGVLVLEDGIQLKSITEGTGGSPALSDQVQVHYTGKLIDGKVFDSSQGGEPAKFLLGGVIKGWQVALQKMKVGGKALIYIPADQAYGVAGSPPAIGPNEVLIFEVELLDIL